MSVRVVAGRFWLAALLMFSLLVPSLASAQSNQLTPYSSAKRYDGKGRIIGTIDPDPDGTGPLLFPATRTVYDALGLPLSVETGDLAAWQNADVLPANWTGFTVKSIEYFAYDTMDRKVRSWVTDPTGGIQSIVQSNSDRAGRPACSAVRMNSAVFSSLPANACSLGTQGSLGPDRITRNIYDAAGQVLRVQKAVGTSLQQDYVTYTYSTNGKQASVKDANGNLAILTYDGYDRQTRWTFPSKSVTGSVDAADYEEYGYDSRGNRTSLRKRDGSTINYQFDALNRNTVKLVPERSGLSSTHTRDVYYSYDLLGRQLSARFDSTGGEGVVNAYDGFGRLTSSTLTMDGISRTLSHQWDRNGNRVELGWMDGNKTSYSYDYLDRMTNLYQGALGSTTAMVNYSYDRFGPLSSQTGLYGQKANFTYDIFNRPLLHELRLTGSSQTVSFSFNYSPANQMISRVTSNDSFIYASAVNVNRNYGVNGLNQYTSAGAASFTYDSNGNLTSDGATTYVYDIENRLISAAGATAAVLRYDPLGRLYESVDGSSVTTRFLYDGDELVSEFNSSGTLLRRYAHGARTDDPALWYEGTGFATPKWLHANWQGSIVAVTDSTPGIVAVNNYDEWGLPAATYDSSGNPQVINYGRFQYTGQMWMPELGLYHYKARIYSPRLGRFLQTDPVGYEDQQNLYAYAGNDPLNFNDSSGKCAGAVVGEPVEIMVCGTALAEIALTTIGVIGTKVAVDKMSQPVTSLPMEYRFGQRDRMQAKGVIVSGTTSEKSRRRPDDYLVNVQIQGSEVGGNRSFAISSETPITAAQVNARVLGLFGTLPGRQKPIAGPAVVGSQQQVAKAVEAGGVGPGTQLRGLNKLFSPGQVRVDIEIINGINLQR